MGAPWQASQQRVMRYSAVVFRKLLSSLSRPGTIEAIPPPDALGAIPGSGGLADGLTVEEGPEPYNRYALGMLATLLDRETGFVLGLAGRWIELETPLSRWLERFSGARMHSPSSADFALCLDGRTGALLSELRQGSDAAPEESATAIICVSDLVTEPLPGETRLELQGPGIRGTSILTTLGLPAATYQAIVATRQAFPLGVDVVLIDRQGRCVGMPRTTRLSIASMSGEES